MGAVYILGQIGEILFPDGHSYQIGFDSGTRLLLALPLIEGLA